MRRTEDLPRMTSCHVSDPEGEVPGMRVTILMGERGRRARRNRGQVEQHARQRHVANMAETVTAQQAHDWQRAHLVAAFAAFSWEFEHKQQPKFEPGALPLHYTALPCTALLHGLIAATLIA